MHEIYVAKAGRETGPFTPEQLPSMLDAGMLSLTDSVWHQDLPSWIPVHQFLNVRPPVPEAPAPSTLATASPAIEAISHSGEPARFGRRFGASSIDAIIWFVIASIFSGIGNAVLLGDTTAGMSDAEYERIVLIPAFVIGWLYSAGMESGPWRATVGKLVFGAVVVDLDGRPISFWRATRRYLWKVTAAMTLGLTLLPAAWTRRRQNVHDLLSSTLVLRK